MKHTLFSILPAARRLQGRTPAFAGPHSLTSTTEYLQCIQTK